MLWCAQMAASNWLDYWSPIFTSFNFSMANSTKTSVFITIIRKGLKKLWKSGQAYLPHNFLACDWQVQTYNKEGRWKSQVSKSKSIILLFIDNILKQIDVSHCLVKILSLKCLKRFVFIREICKDHLWCTTWTCKNLKFLKSLTVLSSWGIYMRTAHNISHGLAKISSLKFLKSSAVLSSLGIYLRTTFDISHGLAKISSLNFLKSSAVLSSWGIYLRTAHDISHGLAKS